MTRATSCVLLVVGGRRGSGFTAWSADPQYAARLPGLLRFVALEIERGVVSIGEMDE